MMADINETLKARGAVYGDFLEQSKIALEIKNAMRRRHGWLNLDADQREAMEFFAVKMARIINGDPHYVDNWRDIGGYAELVAKRLEGK